MSEQALDLRRSAQIVRRHRVLVSVVTAFGILAGSAYAALKPPMVTSTALVVLPQPAQSAQSAQGAVGGAASATDPYTATQEVIAGSTEVLSGALPSVHPHISLNELRNDIQVGSLTTYIVSVNAKGKTAADAEETANAVAQSYIHYIGSTSSPVGPVQAHLLQAATTATGSAPQKQFIIDALAGALFGALLGAIVALVIRRHDRRLRKRDEIADSIGVPVLASVSARRPSDAAGWARLLEDYKPGDVDAWRLRKALYQLGVVGLNAAEAGSSSGSSLAVLSLSSDRNALALGPQLAVLAASLGIRTALVIGPQQDTNATATLRAVCDAPASPKRSANLRVMVSDHDHDAQLPGAALTIVVTVVDGKTPRVADTMHTTTTVLGVSAGAASAEQLARVAASAAADGREIAGIVVADPDPADPTTGRLPQMARPGQRRMPTRITGAATEIRH
jgi:capsular polysaccharide biosynthesis protein